MSSSLDELPPGATVALGDGSDISSTLCALLSAAARRAGGIRLLLGWCLSLPPSLELDAFADARTYFAGGALTEAVHNGWVRYVPATFAALPALFQTVWRPDLVVCTSRPGRHGLTLGTQVGWIPSAARAAGRVVTEINHALPHATGTDALAGVEVEVVSECESLPTQVAPVPPDEVYERIGRNVASLIPEGAAVQFPPGRLGEAVLARIEVPVHVRSGILGDPLAALDARGLLLGDPLGAYLAGSRVIHEWANGRGVLDEPRQTHDTTTLVAHGLVAVNAALQIDLLGQVNVEFAGARARPVAALGGHTDFAVAAVRAPQGASIVALPSSRGGVPTLVERLTTPTSTSRSLVDYIVTEHGVADLRGTDDAERVDRISTLWARSTA